MALKEYALMPSQDYQDACDAIRAVTGATHLIKSGEMAGLISSVKSGNDKWAKNIDALQFELIPEDFANISLIRNHAFMSSEVTSVEIPETIRGIGEGAFADCWSLTNIWFPDSVTHINPSMCEGSAVKSVRLGSYTTRIGFKAFSATNITEIDIPSAVTNIEGAAFATTSVLTVRMHSTTPPTVASTSFKSQNLSKIIVPKGSASTYKSATNWSSFASFIVEES